MEKQAFDSERSDEVKAKTERHLFRAAVYVVFEKDDRYLFIRRFNTGWRDGEYTLPAGHIEKGETGVETCIHESAEEVCLDIDSDDMTLAHIMQYAESGGPSYFYLFYIVSNWTGEPKIGEPDKCDDLKWFAKGELDDEPIIPPVKNALDHISRGEIDSYYIDKA